MLYRANTGAQTPLDGDRPHVVHLAGQPVRDLQNVCFTGFDQSTPVDLKRNLENLDSSVNLLVLHQLCKGTVPDIEGQQTWDLDPEWVPEHVKLVLMGDYHIMWTCTNTKGTQLIYPGSTAVQAIDESDQKYFLVLVVGVPASSGWSDTIWLAGVTSSGSFRWLRHWKRR